MPDESTPDDEGGVEAVLTTLREDLMGSDGYLVVLLLTILTVVMIPIDETFRLGPIVTALLLGALVVVTLSRSHVPNWVRKFGVVVVAMSFALAIAIAIENHPADVATMSTRDHWLIGAGALSYCVVLAMCFPAILRRAFSHRKVTLNTVAASLAAYLLLGLIFTTIFRFVNIVDPPFFAQSPVNGFTYEYFSYVTLTTVGYGDYTAAADSGRIIAVVEALLGQVFLVTIVALVVSNLGQDRVQLRRSVTGDSTSGRSDAPD